MSSDGTGWSNGLSEYLATADSPDGTTDDEWNRFLGDRIEEIINRKGSTVHGREQALATYVDLLMTRYSYDEIEHKTGELFPALLKSVKGGGSEKETILGLSGS